MAEVCSLIKKPVQRADKIKSNPRKLQNATCNNCTNEAKSNSDNIYRY